MSSTLQSNKQVARAAILLTILLGFALRLFRLDFQELSGAEAEGFFIGAEFLGASTRDQLPLGDPLSLGSFLLQQFWFDIAGTSEFAFRAMAAFATTTAIPLIFRMARQLRLGGWSSLSGSLLMALSAYATWYGQDATSFAAVLAFTTACTVLALEMIGGRKRLLFTCGYVLCAAAAVHAYHAAALVVLAQNIYLLFLLIQFRGSRRREDGSKGDPKSGQVVRPLVFYWLGAMFALGALWFLSEKSFPFEVSASGTTSGLFASLWQSFGLLAIGESVPHDIWKFDAAMLAAAIVVAGLLLHLLMARRKTRLNARSGPDTAGEPSVEPSTTEDAQSGFQVRSASALLLLYLLVPLVTSWFSAAEMTEFGAHSRIAALPPFLLLLEMGSARIGEAVENWLGWRWRIWVADPGADGATVLTRIPVGRVFAASLIVLLLTGNLYSLRNHYFDAEFSKTRGLRELAPAMDLWSRGLPIEKAHFVQSFPDAALWYYYSGPIAHTVLPPTPNDGVGALQAVAALSDIGVERIVLPLQLGTEWDASAIAQETLASRFGLAAQEIVGGWQLQLYARPNPQEWRLFNVRFANGLTLERAQTGPDFPPAGGRLVVHISWSGDPSALTGGEKLFLHLLDESGNIVAQWDPALRLDSSPLAFVTAMPVPSTLPPGSLRLVAGLYDVTLEGAPRILTTSGVDSFQLAFFQVADCDVCGR